MILDEVVEIIGNSKNIEHYKSLGYNIQHGIRLEVRVSDLSHGSTFEVNVKCDECFNTKKISWSSYYKYTKKLTEKYFCIKCCGEKRKATNNIRYGGNSSMCDPNIAKKASDTNIKKYGNKSSLHGNRQEIIEDIFVKKYGFKNPSICESIKNKIRNTNIEKYGGPSPLSNNDILSKLKNTNIEKYGYDNVFKSPDIINKIKYSFEEKYGMWYTQTDDMKHKSKITCLKRYGYDNYKHSDLYIKDIINNRLERYDLDIISYKERFFTINCPICKSQYNIETDLLYNRYKNGKIVCTICNELGSKYSSSYEDEICEILDKYDISYQRNTNKIIHPYQLDIYIPNLKFAIEVNGIYWHNEIFKDKNYHLRKYNNCIDINICLIQIWEDDWNHKKEIVKSIILNKIGKNKNKIYARKCLIKEVNNIEKKEFLNNNHLQGDVRSSINLGLYYEEKLVSLMTFGSRKINAKEQYELIRFCNVLNTTVIGSASKLFNFFINNYKYETIISYSDNSISNGEIYKFLGFINNTNSTINYYWSNNKYKYHRFNFNKKRLIKQGFDKNKTEVEIMHERGFYRIFGSGNKKWIFESKKV